MTQRGCGLLSRSLQPEEGHLFSGGTVCCVPASPRRAGQARRVGRHQSSYQVHFALEVGRSCPPSLNPSPGGFKMASFKAHNNHKRKMRFVFRRVSKSFNFFTCTLSYVSHWAFLASALADLNRSSVIMQLITLLNGGNEVTADGAAPQLVLPQSCPSLGPQPAI